MADRFNKFTERAQRALHLAQTEAQRLNHNYIGTEHLLLGLVHEGDGVAAKVLSSLGVELSNVRSAVESIIGRGDRRVAGDIGLTPRAKKAIEHSVDEARRLGHHYIGTEHLLLGLVREGDGVAVAVLNSLGVDLARVEAAVAYVLRQSGAIVGPPTKGDAGRAAQSEAVRGALEQADLAARWYEHHQTDTDHLLIGLVRKRASLAAQVLRELGVDQERLLGEFAAGGRDGDTPPASEQGYVGYAPAALAAFDRAKTEADQRHQTPISSGHLLLAILWVPESRATSLLERLGVDADAVRLAVEPRLNDGDSG